MFKCKYRLCLSKTEALYLRDILDSWIEGYKDAAHIAEDSEISPLMDEFSSAIAIRRRLWNKLTK